MRPDFPRAVPRLRAARGEAPEASRLPTTLHPRRAALAILALLPLLAPGAAQAQAQSHALALGPVTQLPIPRYVSLKTDRVNLREGPSKDHRTRWVFQRAGLPVEIVAEFETWRRIRDAEGTEGWVLHSLLSGRRTAQVMPWARGSGAPVAVHSQTEERGDVVARLEPGVIVGVRGCTGTWCRVVIVLAGARDVTGFIRQERLWGVYPGERLD